MGKNSVLRGGAHGLAPGGYYQEPKGNATFTAYKNCQYAACGYFVQGYSAAISQRSFGAGGNQGAGGACGRCFKITGTYDMYSSGDTGPYKSIVVKASDLCPYQKGEPWCGQDNQTTLNQYGSPIHFDLCEDTKAASAFFPTAEIGALGGYYEEVSCSLWNGYDGSPLWGHACMKGEDASFWPHHAGGCDNVGYSP